MKRIIVEERFPRRTAGADPLDNLAACLEFAGEQAAAAQPSKSLHPMTPITCTRCLDEGFTKTARVVTKESFRANEATAEEAGCATTQPAVGEIVIDHHYCSCAAGEHIRTMEEADHDD